MYARNLNNYNIVYGSAAAFAINMNLVVKDHNNTLCSLYRQIWVPLLIILIRQLHLVALDRGFYAMDITLLMSCNVPCLSPCMHACMHAGHCIYSQSQVYDCIHPWAMH